jgi:hypothetical protein
LPTRTININKNYVEIWQRPKAVFIARTVKNTGTPEYRRLLKEAYRITGE